MVKLLKLKISPKVPNQVAYFSSSLFFPNIAEQFVPGPTCNSESRGGAIITVACFIYHCNTHPSFPHLDIPLVSWTMSGNNESRNVVIHQVIHISDIIIMYHTIA